MVARKAYIRSGGYSICFDKEKPLGMIAPEWVPHEHAPAQLPQGHGHAHVGAGGTGRGVGTAFFLEFDEHANEAQLLDAMHKAGQPHASWPLPDGVCMCNYHSEAGGVLLRLHARGRALSHHAQGRTRHPLAARPVCNVRVPCAHARAHA